MSISVIPNSGPLFSDYLDGMRVEALTAIDADRPIPEAVAAYINALEKQIIDDKAHQRKGWVKDLWASRVQPKDEPS